MEDNLSNLLYSELISATGYVDRIFQGLFLSNLHSHRQFKSICQTLYSDIANHLNNNLFNGTFLSLNEDHGTREIYKQIGKVNNVINSTMYLNENYNEKSITIVVDFINILYLHAKELHDFCNNLTILNIQSPRINLIHELKSKNEKNNKSEIKEFRLNIEDLKKIAGGNLNIYSSIFLQREKKHEDLIEKGHIFISNQLYKEALTTFEKAMSCKETAEVMTLVAWGHLLNKNADQAKSYCMKAIRKDPDYGPPYNDLGNILLSEGQINESIQWFKMSKKAPNYQHKEYPYINTGRAYIMQNKIEKAIIEFETALKIAPFHKELKLVVEKIKAKKESKNNYGPINLGNQFENLSGINNTPLT